MSALEPVTHYIQANGLDPKACMNMLQQNGIISDNCITSDDIARANALRAIAFLERWMPKPKS